MNDTPPTSPKIETLMRVEACPACALVFSLPLDFYLGRLNDQTPIHCPAGHTYTPAKKSRDPLLSIELTELNAEVRQLRAEIERSRAYIARSPLTADGNDLDEEIIARDTYWSPALRAQWDALAEARRDG